MVTGAILKVADKLGSGRGFVGELINLHGKHVKQPVGPASKQDRIKMQTAIGNGMKFALHEVAIL